MEDPSEEVDRFEREVGDRNQRWQGTGATALWLGLFFIVSACAIWAFRVGERGSLASVALLVAAAASLTTGAVLSFQKASKHTQQRVRSASLAASSAAVVLGLLLLSALLCGVPLFVGFVMAEGANEGAGALELFFTFAVSIAVIAPLWAVALAGWKRAMRMAHEAFSLGDAPHNHSARISRWALGLWALLTLTPALGTLV